MNQHILYTSALRHEIEALQSLAGTTATPFPKPDWYQPDNEIEVLVKRAADWCKRGESHAQSKTNFLRPVLPRLAGGSTAKFLAPIPIRTDASSKPTENPKSEDFVQTWAELCSAASEIRSMDASTYPVALQNLLAIYTSNLPAVNTADDISFYAAAHCRAAFCMSIAASEAEPQRAESLCLISGELSGIQDFLFDIGTTFAGKLLKGRSFYVTLLCDSIRRRILTDLGLQDCHTLIDSGGKFVLLAPASAMEKLQAIRAQIDQKIWAEHRETLRFFLTAIPLETETGFSEAMTKLQKAQKAAKKLPNETILKHSPEYLFEAEANHIAYAQCAVTGEMITDIVQAEKDFAGEDDPNPIRLCAQAELQYNLGKWLKGFKYWLVYDAANAPKGSQNIADLGICHQFTANDENIGALKENAAAFYVVNPQNANAAKQGFVWYGGAKFPADESRGGEPKSFDELGKTGNGEGENEGNLQRLGYLRMDVDDLGTSIQSNVRSWARYVQVSRSLDHFFKARLDNLRNQRAYESKIVIVYAGGDDIFAVGVWNDLADFAHAIRHDFQDFCSGNAKPAISGGMILIGTHFPIAKAAQLAGEAEDKAKAHVQNGQSKDSFCMLDFPLKWTELETVSALKAALLTYIDAKLFDRSLLHKLQRHFKSSQQQRLENDATAAPNTSSSNFNYNWRWRAVWDLSRYKENLKKPQNKSTHEYALWKSATQFLKAQLDLLYNSNREDSLKKVSYRGIAARWAELEMRSRVESENTAKEFVQH